MKKCSLGGLLICVLAITSQAESNLTQIKKQETIKIVPAHVSGSFWHNTSDALVQDVDEYGVYQSFTKQNATFFDGTKPDDSLNNSSSNLIPQNELNASGTIEQLPSAPSVEESQSSDIPLETTTATPPPDGIPNTPSEPTSNTLPSETPTSETPVSDTINTTVSAFNSGDNLYTVIERVWKPMKFAQESISEPLVSESQNNVIDDIASSSTETQSVSSHEPEPTSETQEPEITDTDVNNVQAQNIQPDDTAHNTIDEFQSTISFSDFKLPRLDSGQFIRNMQLRMSMSALMKNIASTSIPSLVVEYSFGKTWENAGMVLLDGESSNALNGGYFLFALPKITKASDLDNFSARISYVGNVGNIETIFIDALWLEINTDVFDKALLHERITAQALTNLELPKMYEFLSNDLDFTREELPKFALRYDSQRNGVVQFIRNLFGRKLADIETVTFSHGVGEPIALNPNIDVTDDGHVTIQLTSQDIEKLEPGAYTVKLVANEGGKLFTDSFTFQWGVLAVNTDKTQYTIGERTNIMLGAVSESGNTICDAQLQVYVIDPLDYINEAVVTPSGKCNGNNYIDVPDFITDFTPTMSGTYEIYVERIGTQGEVLAHTSDTFRVVDTQPLTLSRTGPTRINPKYTYPMTLTLSAQKNFTGDIVEYVPADFNIVSTDAVVREVNGMHELRWHVSLQKDESMSVEYTFDAPDISPFLYTLGPAEVIDAKNLVVVREHIGNPTQQLVTESITESVIDDSAHTATSPSVNGETIVDQHTTITEVQPLPDDSLLDSIIDTNTLNEILDINESTTVQSTDATTSIPVVDTTINATTSATSENVFTEHRKWQIASDATGSMIVFWTDGASIPANWTCISCVSTDTFYQRFPLGGATYGTSGGVPTTTHTANGSVNASTVANAENTTSGSVSIVSHSHTLTPNIGSTTTLPAYRQLRVIQSNNAGDPGTLPAGAILIFDGTLPSGWSPYTPLDNRYPRGEDTITSAGSNTHIHNVTGTTSAASGTTYNSRPGGPQVTAAASTHTHTISSSTPAISQEPPYIEVIFATSTAPTTTPVNAIAMWSDTPPAGWLDRSSDATKPFYNRYIKGASTYGTTGGADTHTHDDMSITSGQSIGTINARSGSAGAGSTHTHAVATTNFSTASNTPPYVTTIFAKFYGYIPIYDQSAFRWYVNDNTSLPTDPWPVGVDDLLENDPIDVSSVPVKNGDIIRLRMGLNVSNSTTTGESFKLQFGTTTALCTEVSSWSDVGQLASSTAWIGYNNTTPVDGVTLSSSTLSATNVYESYEETNPSVTLPNEIGIGQNGEWDYVLKQNNAVAGATYCFRMVQSDGTALFSYTQYPMLVTNNAPQPPSLSKLFDNEKIASTTPRFEFTTTDVESNDITYQIQIDDDKTFGSVNIDNDTVNNGDQFENLNTPADKDPFTNGEIIRFTSPSALTNGVTYYWRVRGQDPNGSNAWGTWSTVYSFTIDTSVTVSTWYQTTEEQFDTDILSDTDALVTDVVQLATGSTTGTTTSSAIEFSTGSIGNAWGSLAWTDTETSSNLKYRLQYYDTDTNNWLFIPDSALAGNSAGFGTSPISLIAVDIQTYSTLRVLAIFTNAGASPILSDWTLSWGYRIDTPTTNAPFPNEKVSTTTPTFEFYTTDPQNDDLVYEIQWSTSYAFTASTTRISSVDSGFINIQVGADTSPFNSGNIIQFTMQPADALTNGTTYWWRVRAIDPAGSNQYSFYANPQSITVDTAVAVSTWFQTTTEQFDTDILSGTVSQSGNTATVATTTVESLIAYAEGVITTPRYRIWNGTSWSAEASALDVGASISWVITRSAPAKNEYILATMGTDADVNVQVYKDGAWGNLQEVTTSIANTNMRGFDVAYEQISGDALIVTCDGDANPTYYLWNGTTWTNSGAIGLTSGNTCGWIKLISNPVSDEIIVVTRDVGGTAYEARVWNGSSWGNSTTWGSMQSTQTTHEGIAAQYEESGNQAVVAVSNGTASSFVWRAWSGGVWSASTAVSLGDDFEAGTLVADKGTDTMELCYIDEDRDIGSVRWTGSAWTGQIEHYTTWTGTNNLFDDRPIDCIFEVGGARDGNIMVTYATTTGIAYQAWNGTAWSTAAKVSTLSPAPRVQARRTGNNLIQMMSYASTTDRYDYTYWNGTSWSALQTLETDGSSGATPFKEPLMNIPKNPITTGTIIGNPLIDFYKGSGPYWQQMSWTDTTTGGSDILYQVQYYDTTSSSWKLIPDTLIPGNSVGTTTSPINLTNVLPASAYSKIRPVANLTCNLGTCPVLSDWTITWSAGITISGTAQQFDQSTNVTSGTVAIAVNGVLQIGKTGTISGGTWSIANVNTAPGDILTLFVNGVNDSNEAVAIARYDGVGDMSGLQLYEQHLTLGSSDATSTPFTNADIGLYDFTNDEDLFFDVSGTSLTMCADATCGDSELYIMASSTYKPTGTANLNNLENNGTLTFEGNTVYVARSWDNNATTTSASSHIIFTATSTTETLDETGAVTPSFYDITFGTTTGSAIWNIITPLDINNNLTVTRGTLARGNTSLTVAGTLTNGVGGIWTGMGTTTFDGSGTSNWSDSNATLQNIGRVVIDGTSKTIQLSGNVKAQSLIIGADDVLDVSTSNYQITILSDFINNNTFVARNGTVFMSATTTNKIITAGSDAFYNLTFNGVGGAWSFTEPTLMVNHNLTIATGTLTMPTGTTTLAGSFSSVGGTFGHNNATVIFTASSPATISASGTPFTNAFYNIRFDGSGSFVFLDTSATTSKNITIAQGAVTFPSAHLSIGGSFTHSGGTFVHNSGTVKFTSASAETIDISSSPFNSISFNGTGSWSFIDPSITALGSVWVSAGTVTLPSNTLTIGGSYGNFATVSHASGTVLFNSTDGGEIINFGNSPLYNVTMQSAGGGWTITNPATTTNNFTLASSSSFILASGQTLSVGSQFINSVGGASTTWTGSTLSLESGTYSLNGKTQTGDVYDTLRVKNGAHISSWNSSAVVYDINASGSLYSQDHAGVDGNLYIFGSYTRTTGNEYWSYATDFDGTILTASSSRQVDVRLANNASAILSGALFSVQGTSTATTTIANQGSGTYTITSAVATSTFNFYDFSNLGITGVTLSGTGTIASLDDGVFNPGINAGTGLTISSATIDANAGMQIYRVNFSTTTAISATNATLSGGVPSSYWWFRESSGNIDGEAFDADNGDPGAIRWDDSSLSITISGTVFSDDGVTPMGASTCDDVTQNIRIVVQNGASYTGSCASANGTYSIPGVIIVGSPVITIYLDTNGGSKGVVITKTPTGNISNLNIYVNRVMTRHEDMSPLTIADMAVFDIANDSDIPYDAATGTVDSLVVSSDTELHIASSTTFAPGGNITLNAHASSSVADGSLHIDDNATLIGFATSTIIIGGSFSMDAGATFTSASTTVLMNATTTGKTLTTTPSQEIAFNELHFNGTGGGWNVNGNIRALQNITVTTGTLTGTADVRVVNGSMNGNGIVSFGSGTTTIENTNTLGGTTSWTFGNLVLGNGTGIGTTTAPSATTTVLGMLTISNAHFLNAQGSIWNLAGTGNVFVETGTFLEGTSTVRYSGAGNANVISTTYYNLDLMAQANSPTYTAGGLGIIVSNNLTLGGATTTTFTLNTNDPALDVNGNVFITANGVLHASNLGLFTVAGNWDNKGILTHNSGTVTFDGSGTTNIYAGTSWFNNTTINGSGTFVVQEHATSSSAFTLTNAGSFTLASGQSLAVGGTFTNGQGGGVTTWIGSKLFLYGGNYTINASTTSDTYATLSIGSNTQIRMWNSSASTYDISSTGSLYSQDNANVNGDLFIYGTYIKSSGNDYWNYATDFDGTDISGTPRAVHVYVQGGSSIFYTSGGLAVMGISTASTTLQNQGSGTYSFRVGGTASTTMNYYQIRDTDSAGLTFSGTPNVINLSNGNFAVSQNGSSAMTVGGTVITQNPAKTFTNNFFGTTTGISSAINVTATGTSVSSWRFTNHSGMIAGETFDVDPNGDPGYIVWDDSAALITISGNVYSDEGSTVSTICDGVTNNISLRVAGLTSYTTNCNAGTGQYSISGIAYSPGDSIVLYIDGQTAKAATITEDPISNIGNLDIYENRVIVRHESSDPLSIADMAVWDSSDDADIPFTAVDAGTDTLTLPANRKLLIWASKEFKPLGNITLSGGGGGSAYDGTLELQTNALFTASAGETHSVGGSFISGAGAIVNTNTASFTFTTTGAGRTIDTNDVAFADVTFNGSGSWTVSNTTLATNNLTITQGSVSLPSATTTIAGSLSVTGGSFNANNGLILFTGSGGKTIRSNGSLFGALTLNGSGSYTMLDTNATTTRDLLVQNGTLTSASGTVTIGGNFINTGTFNHGNGILRFISASSTIITAGGSDLYTTRFAGTGTFTFTNTNVALLGSLLIDSGSVTYASGTMSIAGSLVNTGGSFNHASGTILFNSSDTGEIINPGQSPFYAVTFGSASGGWTISNNATTTSHFTLSSASNFTLASSTRLTVGGVFTNVVGGANTTWTGSTLVINSGVGYTINTKTTGGDTYNNIIVGSSTALRTWDSAGTISIADSVSSFYSQDNAGVSGALSIFGNYSRTTGSDYWSYATDFDGASLTGSTTRQVFVYMAQNATTTLYAGGLNIIGVSGFSTTINNQGSGTYALRVLGGTLNAQYYSLSNMNANGLVLSGTSAITSLTNGSYTLSLNGGSLITLSSTTLNQNAGLVIANASFATTSAITGTNITVVGTTPSAWTLTGHTGNLAGEAFDSDGGDACGSIRWSDSSCLLTQQSGYRFRNDDGGEGVPNSEWYNASWTKRTRVTIANADSAGYANATIKLTVPYDGDMQTDFDDLRFTSADGITPLSYYREKFTASTDAVVWVKVPLLATSTNTQIFMYYGEGSVSDASATSTFSFIDNYEDGNITEYTGETSQFTVNSGSAYERTYRLEAADQNNGKTTAGGMYNDNVTVSQGQKLRYVQYIDTGTGSGDETCTRFGVQSAINSYAVCLELFGVDRLSLAKNVLNRDTSGTVLASSTVTYATGWYEVEVSWNTNNLIYVALSQNGSIVATTSATDSTYSSGGVGYTLWGYHGGWDVYSARTLLQTEPTVTFGFEQVPNGASWRSTQDTPLMGANIGDKVRIRFLIENTGLPVNNQNYRVEYAGKGNSPSCEAVNYTNYTAVLPQASCGTNDICMQSSTYFTNLASTTDILGGNGTFTNGQMVEDGSNSTGNISIQSNQFTELEYVITPTTNTTDSNYCFRVTNAGTSLDSYAHVAEMKLIFAPNITSLSLNGGLDIALSGGATTTIYATGTVSDMNGYADITDATTTIFRSGVGGSCTADNNNCYISSAPQCSFSNCAGNSCDIICSADIYYHADPTDIGTFAAETWRALLTVNDAGGSVATATAPSIDLLTLRAISVNNSINYGALAVDSDTGSYNATTSIQNIGNDSLDIGIEGTNLTSGASVIPVWEQKFATSTFTYASCTTCNQLATTTTNMKVDLSKPASTTPSITDELYWGIAIPFGVAGTAHQGTNIFYAIGDF